MINEHKIVVVLPAYNARQTLAQTYAEIPMVYVDEVLLVDDYSTDNTHELACELGIKNVVVHDNNKGYGANQKTCYQKALDMGADIVVMLHPDYQYTPALLPAMVSAIAWGTFPVMLGSRILGNGALKGGMPLYKYIANRFLTFFQNLVMGQKLSEYHTGYRAYHRKVLEAIPFMQNSNDFLFDNQLLAQIAYAGFTIGEISCPTRYNEAASSISFRRSVKYGFGVLGVSIKYRLSKLGFWQDRMFKMK